jgi:hypothetical protein
MENFYSKKKLKNIVFKWKTQITLLELWLLHHQEAEKVIYNKLNYFIL